MNVMTAMNDQLTRKEFERIITLRMCEVSGEEYSELHEYACEVLDSFLAWELIDYGDSAYDWSQDAAIGLADEDISYWTD